MFRNARLLRYANIIFDLERTDALKTVHGYLDDLGIAYCGRYGDWGYLVDRRELQERRAGCGKALSALTAYAA